MMIFGCRKHLLLITSFLKRIFHLASISPPHSGLGSPSNASELGLKMLNQFNFNILVLFEKP